MQKKVIYLQLQKSTKTSTSHSPPPETNLSRLFADAHPIEGPMLRLVNHIPEAIEAQNVITDTGCPSRFHFMLVSEQFLPRLSPTVV